MLLVKSRLLRSQVLIFSFLMVFPFSRFVCSEEVEVIQYITDKERDVSATLIPDPSPGKIPTSDNQYVTFKLDETPDSVSLLPAGNNATIKKRISSLAEGRHSASLTTLTPEKSIKDKKQLLFYYDTTPPKLERVFPEADEILKQNVSFMIEFSDEGSGIPSLREEMDVSATINGSEAAIRSTYQNDKRFFVIDLNGDSGDEDTSYSLYLSLKDRAGNEATLSDTLHTQSDYKKSYDSTKKCGGKKYSISYKLDVNFPISSRYVAGAISSENKSYVLSVKIGSSEDLDNSILHSINVTSNHPAVKVSRLANQNNEVQFKITQPSPVSFADGLAFLTVEFPSKLSLHYKWKCGSWGGAPYPTFDSATVSSDRNSFRIPVLLYLRDTMEFKNEVITENGNTFFQFSTTWSNPNARTLDTAASVLTFQDSHYFFNENDSKYTAKAPVEKEGYYTFKAKLVLEAGIWTGLDSDSPSHTVEDEVFVNLGPPTISSFKYNKQKSQLEASFSDIGTPVDDLKITLSVEGFGERDFTLQKQSDGNLLMESPFPLPASIVGASLTVTDLAENTVKGTCKIYGTPPDSPDQDDSDNVRYRVKSPSELPEVYSPNPVFSDRADITPLNSRYDGLSNIRKCTKERMFSLTDYHYRVPTWERWILGYTKVTDFYPYDMFRQRGVYSDIIHTQFSTYRYLTSIGFSVPPPEYYTYTFNVCENQIADILPPVIKNITFDPSTGKITAKISDHGRLVSGIKTELKCVRSAPPLDYQRKPTDFPHKYIANPTPVRKVVNTSYRPAGSTIPAYVLQKEILDSLRVQKVNRFLSASAKTPARTVQSLSDSELYNLWLPINKYIDYLKKKKEAASPPQTISREHGLVGNFNATIPVPPLEAGEVFDVSIYATDLSGNKGVGTLELTVPQNPPQVYLELAESAGSSTFSSLNGTKITSQFNATAVDDSGLNYSKIRFAVDNQTYSPLLTYDKGDVSEWAYAAIDDSLLEVGLSRRWTQDIFAAYYGVYLQEGGHVASFSATDTLGLSSETTLDFGVEYAPFITDFTSKPKTVQDRGGPAFTATILDRGNDLSLDGIIFIIDGVVIERDKLFYDSPSGYFSVAGPLEMSNGFHVAEITATDSHGHQDQKNLRFVVSDTVTAAVGGEDNDLRLNGVDLWELENHNNDGLANPGEFIRLFPTLLSSAQFPFEHCRASLSAQDSRIIVENHVAHVTLNAATTTTLVRGFDLQIGQDILDNTTSDPYETHLDLQIDCSEDKWNIPFTLPIYSPTFTTDPVPGPTATPPPFVPPSVTLNTPIAGDFFQCNPIPISGTYSTGSSTLQTMEIIFSNISSTCTISPVDSNTFSGECTTNMIFTSGPEVIEVRVITDQGATATDTVIVNTGSCS